MNPTDRILTPEELAEEIDGVDGILSMVTDRIDPELMDRTPSLKVVANFAVGYNNYERELDIEEGLLGSASVILAPHIASASYETRLEMCMIAADNLIAASVENGRKTL
jgi:lactate dehydrogenase-like 2-hydroxyacid dehydrogenase